MSSLCLTYSHMVRSVVFVHNFTVYLPTTVDIKSYMLVYYIVSHLRYDTSKMGTSPCTFSEMSSYERTYMYMYSELAHDVPSIFL